MAEMGQNFGGKLPRREILKGLAAGGFAAGLGGNTARGEGAKPLNRVQAENQKPGTTEWQLTYVRGTGPLQNRSVLIEGYCSETSVLPGGSIDIFLSADPATEVTIDFYRMGYYAGNGGRHVQKISGVAVKPQKTPESGKNRLRECQWEKSLTFQVPEEWVSGVYLGKLSCAGHRYQSYIVFIVKEERESDLLFQCSDNTWQAYNKWPDTYSLYDAEPPHSLSGVTRVSRDRPYAKYWQVIDQPLTQGSGEFLAWEFPLCFWLEKEGYDVTYSSNVDTHRHPEGLAKAKVLLSVGHDEYWSLEMYENVRQAIQNGLSVAFLSGNTCCFVAPQVPATDGRPDRVFHRGGRYGGLLEAEKGQMGPFDMEGPNENLLIGARTISPFNGSGDWIVTKPRHWIFEGTGLKEGDRIPGLVGWEFHGDPAAIAGLEVVAEGQTINGGDNEAIFTATVYPGPKGNWVFNASTIFWSMGLSKPPGVIPPHSHYGRPHGPDERVQKITGNFLKGCGVG